MTASLLAGSAEAASSESASTAIGLKEFKNFHNIAVSFVLKNRAVP